MVNIKTMKIAGIVFVIPILMTLLGLIFGGLVQGIPIFSLMAFLLLAPGVFLMPFAFLIATILFVVSLCQNN